MLMMSVRCCLSEQFFFWAPLRGDVLLEDSVRLSLATHRRTLTVNIMGLEASYINGTLEGPEWEQSLSLSPLFAFVEVIQV